MCYSLHENGASKPHCMKFTSSTGLYGEMPNNSKEENNTLMNTKVSLSGLSLSCLPMALLLAEYNLMCVGCFFTLFSSMMAGGDIGWVGGQTNPLYPSLVHAAARQHHIQDTKI